MFRRIRRQRKARRKEKSDTHKSSSKQRKRHHLAVVNDDDEDSDEIVRKKGRILAEEDDDYAQDSGEDTGEDDDDEEEEEEGDFSLYRRLENMHDEVEESTPIVFRQNISVPEAMTLYIDMIAKLLSPSSSSTPQHGQSTPSMFSSPMRRSEMNLTSQHKTAIRKIEGLICTSRESLLGSSAWKGEFYEQLKTRPFYTVVEVWLPCCCLLIVVVSL